MSNFLVTSSGHRAISLICAFLLTLSSALSRDACAVFIVDYQQSFLDYQGSDLLRVVQGGEVAHLKVLKSSRAEVVGGEISHMSLLDNSSALITSGSISHLNAYDTASIVVDLKNAKSVSYVGARGQYANSELPAAGNSHVTIVSGYLGVVTAELSGRVNVLGDTMGLVSYFGGIVDVHGGSIVGTSMFEGLINFYGGTIGTIKADPGRINVFGGTLNNIRGSDLGSLFGDVHVYGRQLSYSGIRRDRLTGFLADGSPINARVDMASGRLFLHAIPEPATTPILIILLIMSGNLRVSRCKIRARLSIPDVVHERP